MAINIGKLIGDIEKDVAGFVRDPLSVFSRPGLTNSEKEKLAGIRRSLPTAEPPSPARAVPPVPAGGGPVTINFNITLYPNGVATIGTDGGTANSPHSVTVGPPPDMSRGAQSSPQSMSAVQGLQGVAGSSQPGAQSALASNPRKPAKSGKPGR